MALFCINLAKPLNSAGKSLLSSNLNAFAPILYAGMTSKTLREPKPKPAPYPYKSKNYRFYNRLFDSTTSRFDENTKIIVVDGPVAAGKTKFAKAIAEEFEMLHIPEATLDIKYINPAGFDMRKLDPQMPDSFKSFDERNFCLTPSHPNAAKFQVDKYFLKFSVYIDALAHLLSTGQGVVMERSPWGDKVFAEAMFRNQYLSKEAFYVYNEVRRHTIHHLFRPHLILYLDVPVPKVMEKIKKRNYSHEVNGPALTKKYLEDVEDLMKTQYLKDLSVHSELLIYDWSEEGDVEVVVEDIQRIDFDKYGKFDKKLADWRLDCERSWGDARVDFADEKLTMLQYFNVPLTEAPELMHSGEDSKIYEDVWYSAPGMEYTEGYLPKIDKNILFKVGKTWPTHIY